MTLQALIYIKEKLRSQPVLTRFAPSPSGYLHLGHLLSAIYVWGLADALGGAVLLRIEDHDQSRTRPEFVEQIYRDLAWLGFTWQRSYVQMAEPQRFAAALARLAGSTYRCTCSRKEILSQGVQGPELRYPGTCRALGHKEGASLRWRMPEGEVSFEDASEGPKTATPAAQCGDLLIQDRLGQWTYQFAVVVDDCRDGVNLVVRGRDLIDSTARQILLAEALGCPQRPLYYHHPLIFGSDGVKLSKSLGSEGIKVLREQGWAPEAVLGEAAARAGLLPKGGTLRRQDLADLLFAT